MRRATPGPTARALLLLALAFACGCGAAPGDSAMPVAIGRATMDGHEVVEPPVLLPISAEAAAATKARGDAVFVEGDLVLRGASAGLVIGRFEKDRTALLEQAVLYLPDAASDILLIGDTAYVASGPRGIVAVDVSEPTAPKAIAAMKTSGAALRFHLDATNLVVADGAGGVLLVDVSSPAAPKPVARWTSVDHVRHAIASGPDVYVAEGRAGISRLKVTATGLVHVLRHDTAGQARALEERDGRLYVADGPGGLLILEIREGGFAKLGQVPMSEMARDIELSKDGRHAFVAAGNEGVIVVDVADPSKAAVVGAHVAKSPANRLRRQGDTLYVGVDSGGFIALDVSEPGEPTRVFPIED